MIIVVSSPALSHSTDPTAAAVTAGFRPASFEPTVQTEKALAGSAQFDLDRLYPSLSQAQQPARALSPIAHALAALRHAALI